MARGTIVEMNYWQNGSIRPDGGSDELQDVIFHWKDVRGMSSYEQLDVGQVVDYDVGRDQRQGTIKAVNIRPSMPYALGDGK